MAKSKKKASDKKLNSSRSSLPAISVVIPMYNAEKYIVECLDSVLAQTFQDFEVIVVDDCSTDNSFALVKDYVPKFRGRLKIFKTKTNSGGPAKPSNIGITVSRGEYLLLLDNDDAITPTALEELYPIAKKFNADVIACEKYYNIPDKFWNNTEFRRKIKPFSYQTGNFVSEPTLITDNLSERVRDCAHQKFLWNIWSKLIRRDFLTENQIYFNQNMIQDMVFTCCLLFTAKRYVRVPNTINYYRILDDSLSHKKESPEKNFLRYVRTLISGFNFLEKFLSEQEFFKQNPKDKYLALETFILKIFWYLRKFYLSNPPYLFDNLLRQEFSCSNNSALLAYIFNSDFVHRVFLEKLKIQVVNNKNRPC